MPLLDHSRGRLAHPFDLKVLACADFATKQKGLGVQSEPLARFVDRCRSAARWRESLAARHSDARSSRSALALREAAYWAMSDPQAEQYLALDLRDLFDATDWSEAQEYQFTTYCFEEPESRAHWLARVVGADVV